MERKHKLLHETNPDIIQYLVNPKDADNYCRYDTNYIWVKCPNCGLLSYKSVRAFVARPTYCNKCCDGMSYPNKFMLNVLLQIGVNVEPEKTFNWSDNRRYDDYIAEYNTIIENHGAQHYEEIKSKRYMPLVEQKKIDVLKKELALSNGIKHYIEVDCRVSEMEWIKQSIMNSELPKILCFQENDIDWVSCDVNSKKSLLIECCNLWMEKHYNVVEIAQKLHVHRSTVVNYLKSGSKFGLCDYDPHVELQKVLVKGRAQEIECKKCKPIAVYNTIGMIAVFDSAVQLSSMSDDIFGVHISRPMITNVCKGVYNTNFGLKFEYIDKQDYEKIYNNFCGHTNPILFNTNIKYSSHEKPVCVFLEGDMIDIFSSRTEAANVLTQKYNILFSERAIAQTCLCKQKQHNGFIFTNTTREEYEQYKIIEKNNEVVKGG